MTNHIDRLAGHIANGTLIRDKWTGTDADGRETMYLLAALAPQCAEQELV
jgi:hypothetical protein